MSEIPITEPLVTKKPVISVCSIVGALLLTFILPITGLFTGYVHYEREGYAMGYQYFDTGLFLIALLVIWSFAVIAAWVMKGK